MFNGVYHISTNKISKEMPSWAWAIVLHEKQNIRVVAVPRKLRQVVIKPRYAYAQIKKTVKRPLT
jgi:hypothetical protein